LHNVNGDYLFSVTKSVYYERVVVLRTTKCWTFN